MATIATPRPQSPASPLRNQSPASSIRPSIDRPPSNPTDSPHPPPAQRRNRAALRDYYNLNTKSRPSPNLSRTGSIASVASDATPTNDALDESSTTAELDDENFDTDAYIQKLLHTASLKDILRIEATLVSEIRNLDGERKALVYDNYSKLIKATQTIGDMQRSMNDSSQGNLRSLETLQASVEKITDMTRELSRPYAEERSGTAKVKDERRKQETVRWVIDAPKRFETMLAGGQTDEVKAQWTAVSGLLDKWQGITGVDEVRKSCLAVVARIDKPSEGQG